MRAAVEVRFVPPPPSKTLVAAEVEFEITFDEGPLAGKRMVLLGTAIRMKPLGGALGMELFVTWPARLEQRPDRQPHYWQFVQGTDRGDIEKRLLDMFSATQRPPQST